MLAGHWVTACGLAVELLAGVGVLPVAVPARGARAGLVHVFSAREM